MSPPTQAKQKRKGECSATLALKKSLKLNYISFVLKILDDSNGSLLPHCGNPDLFSNFVFGAKKALVK